MYILGLECIGDDSAKFMRSVDCPTRQPWVAEITGLHPKYGFNRQFLRGNKSYAQANSIGSRGVYLYFHLHPGKIYEVFHFTAWTNCRRYFCRVTEENTLEEITAEEAKDCLS